MESLWLIILSISTPIAGVIGFALQLRNVKKARLENEKLNLEIARLHEAKKAAEKQIVVPTNDEVIRYAMPQGSVMQRTGAFPAIEGKTSSSVGWMGVGIGIIAIFMLSYFVYDVYRLGSWVLSKY